MFCSDWLHRLCSFGVVCNEWLKELVDVLVDFCLIGYTGNQISQGKGVVVNNHISNSLPVKWVLTSITSRILCHDNISQILPNGFQQ